VHIAPAAVTALKEHKSSLAAAKIFNQFVRIRVFEHRSRRQGHDYILAMAAVPAPAFPVVAVFRLKAMLVPQMGQGTEVAADLKDHVPAPAAVTAAWAAPGNIFFPVEGNTAVAALSGRDFYERFVSEFFHKGILAQMTRKTKAVFPQMFEPYTLQKVPEEKGE
jgi:hypothetical protein